MLRGLIGDRVFYKRVMALTIPIMIQSGITNFVNMLDNIMVGRLGTAEMTGVAITNQLIFVFNLCVFGAISGAGIFGAQFYGKGDNKGLRDTFRFKILFSLAICVISLGIFLIFGDFLINLYLMGEGSTTDIAETFSFAKEYLLIMLIGIIPFGISQCYSGTLREVERPVIPMVSGLIAVAVNLSLNYVLIYGKLGMPRLGVVGAAIATVISRFAEAITVIVWTRLTANKNPFIIGAFRSFKIPMSLVKGILAKGMPLMLNETLWASGNAVLSQCYSVRGLSVVAAVNITQTFFNVFAVAFLSLGVAAGIILGQVLGSSDKNLARDYSKKLIFLSFMVSSVFCLLYIIAAGFIPNLYNIEPEVKSLATSLMIVCALAMPLDAIANASYFTLRSGGKVGITMIFDCGHSWLIAVPTAFIISRFTSIGIIPFFIIIHSLNLIKSVLGIIFVKKGIWIKTIVTE